MKIALLALNNYNRTNTASFKQTREKVSQKPENNVYSLSRETNEYLDDLNYGYKTISEILNRKNREGINKIVKESGLFTTSDGLTFRKINKDNDSISFESISYRGANNYTKILLKDFNNKIKKGFLIKNKIGVIKNYDLKTPNKLPQLEEFYTAHEADELGLDREIVELLKQIDTPMLKTRLFVVKRKDGDLKLEDAVISRQIFDKLAKLTNLYTATENTCKKIPLTTLTKRKLEFPDYAIQYGQNTHKLKNIGKENLQIIYSNFNNTYNGTFTRIMVYYPDDTVKTGYLLKGNKIVSNFNPQYQSTLPDKIDFVDIEEIKDPHYNEELEEYIDGYAEKLQKFNNFLIERQNTPFNAVSKEDSVRIKEISGLYSQAESVLSRVSNVAANKIKNNFNDYDITAGKKGFTFKNVGPDKKTVNIFKSKANGSEEMIKFTVIKTPMEDEISLTIKNNEKYVSNYKIPEKIMKQKLKVLNYLPFIKVKFNEFNKQSEDYLKMRLEKAAKVAEAQKAEKAEKYQSLATEKKVNNHETEHVKKKRGRPVSSEYSLKPWLKEQEYQSLLSECMRDFKSALKTMKGNLDIFDEETEKIRKRLSDFIESKKNGESSVS